MRVEIIESIDSKKFDLKEWCDFKNETFYPYIYQNFRTFYNKKDIFANLESKTFLKELKAYLEFLSEYIIKNVTLDSNNFTFNTKKLFIEMIITNDDKMKKYNKEYMQKDYATDVLSFPLEIFNRNFIQCFGSIILNFDAILRESKKFKHNIFAEISLLFTHGMLHLLGFDHESDDGAQRKYEKKILESLHLPLNLVDRILADSKT